MTLRLSINGEIYEIESAPDTPLVYVLRDELKLKGTKLACGLEQCGACAVLADDEVAMSCSREVAWFEGKEIVTIEHVETLPTGRAVQQAFLAESAAQCGFCTSGLVVAATALALRDGDPTETAIRSTLDPHLCRCGSHPRVLHAVRGALAALRP